jgi:ABC-type multidrug transport system permease subunit
VSSQDAIIVIGLIFSLLLALINAGTTYNELYDRSEPKNKHPKVEAVRSFIFAFILFILISLAFAFVLPKLIK